MKTYQIKPTDGTAPFTIEADTVEVSETSGAITFKNTAGDIIARQLNVSFRELPAAE